MRKTEHYWLAISILKQHVCPAYDMDTTHSLSPSCSGKQYSLDVCMQMFFSVQRFQWRCGQQGKNVKQVARILQKYINKVDDTNFKKFYRSSDVVVYLFQPGIEPETSLVSTGNLSSSNRMACCPLHH